MRKRSAWWMSYSRYRVIKRPNKFAEGCWLWAVEAEDGEMIRQYPILRYDRAVAFTDKLNHEEWELAMKAKRRPKKKLPRAA